MQKRKTRLFFLALMVSGHALAYTNSESIQVEVTGVIVAPACEVEAPAEVQLGEVERQYISVKNGNSATKGLVIRVSQCSSVTTKATLFFSGTDYTAAPGYLGEIYANDIQDGAKDIGLQMFNLDGKQFVNLGNGKSYELDIDPQSSSAELPIGARMLTPLGNPTVGDFRSSVTINFVYQ